jgi:hypothetical protein
MINDTTNFAISGDSSTCTITDTAALAVGTYGVAIQVENVYGILLSGVFTVRVTAPEPTFFPIHLALVIGLIILVIVAFAIVVWMKRRKS